MKEQEVKQDQSDPVFSPGINGEQASAKGEHGAAELLFTRRRVQRGSVFVC